MAWSRPVLLLMLALQGGQAHAAEEELPPDELLEFLGSFEAADGGWIDPTDFEIPLPEGQVAARGGKQDE